MWLLAATMLALLVLATALHWLRYREHARRHHHDPFMAPFYGAPPMALLTVGAGALLVGRAAPSAISNPYDEAMRAMGVLYGVPMWGFGMVWLAIAAAVTVRTARERLPFSLTWWSFTFPVGTVVTGTSVLASATHADFLRYASVALYALLIAAWLTAATRTTRGALSGRLFLPLPPQPQLPYTRPPETNARA